MSKSPVQRVGHYILCGIGRTGAHIAEEFVRRHLPLVVVENNADTILDLKEKLALAGELQPEFVQGEATADETLQQAGIEQARGLIATMGDDKDNLFVVLTARSLNSRIRIITRVNDERLNRAKMLKAGADKVLSTSQIGGLRAASELIRPSVAKFLEQIVHLTDKTKTLRFSELPVIDIKQPALVQIMRRRRNDDIIAGLTIKDIGQHTGLLVVAIKSGDHIDHAHHPTAEDHWHHNRYRFTPRGNEVLHDDDILVVIGTQDKLDEARGQS